MNQQSSPDDSLTARLQLRGREADPLSCGLMAASADTLHLARRVKDLLENSMTQDEAPLEQLQRLAPSINQFLQLNRVGASMLHLHRRLSQ